MEIRLASCNFGRRELKQSRSETALSSNSEHARPTRQHGLNRTHTKMFRNPLGTMMRQRSQESAAFVRPTTADLKSKNGKMATRADLKLGIDVAALTAGSAVETVNLFCFAVGRLPSSMAFL